MFSRNKLRPICSTFGTRPVHQLLLFWSLFANKQWSAPLKIKNIGFKKKPENSVNILKKSILAKKKNVETFFWFNSLIRFKYSFFFFKLLFIYSLVCFIIVFHKLLVDYIQLLSALLISLFAVHILLILKLCNPSLCCFKLRGKLNKVF